MIKTKRYNTKAFNENYSKIFRNKRKAGTVKSKHTFKEGVKCYSEQYVGELEQALIFLSRYKTATNVLDKYGVIYE